MAYLDIIRAWKDPKYRLSLSDDERALLPENPAGLIELTDAELGGVSGADCTCEPTCCATCPSTCASTCPVSCYYTDCGCPSDSTLRRCCQTYYCQ